MDRAYEGDETRKLAFDRGFIRAAAKYVNHFVPEAKADDLVTQAIETSGLREVVVAPGK